MLIYGSDEPSTVESIINVTRYNERTLEIPGRRATEIVSVRRIGQLLAINLKPSVCTWKLEEDGREKVKRRRRDRWVRGRKRIRGRKVE
jgi:hypothetical protein